MGMGLRVVAASWDGGDEGFGDGLEGGGGEGGHGVGNG